MASPERHATLQDLARPIPLHHNEKQPTGEHASFTSSVPKPQSRWLTRIALPAGVCVGTALLLLGSSYQALLPATQVTASPAVAKTKAGARPGTAVVQAAGWIEPAPYPTDVTALTDGIIEEMFVLEGDAVTKGQVLATLIDDDVQLELRRAQALVKRREAALEEAHAQLSAAQENWDNPIEVDRAAAVASSGLQEQQARLTELDAEIAAAEAELTNLTSLAERLEGAYAERAVTEARLVEAQSARDAQKATLEALKRRRNVLRGQIASARAEREAALDNRDLRTNERRELDLALAAVKRADAELEEARTALDEIELKLERHSIEAPFDGVVLRRFKRPGSKVMRGMDDKHSATIVELYDPEQLQVRVDVPLADASKIAVGQPAEIIAESLPNETFSGEVTRLVHTANIQKNTLEAQVAINDPSPLLRPEVLTRVKFLAMQPESDEPAQNLAVYVPEQAVQDDAVWVVSSFDGTRGKAAKRTVSLGATGSDDWVEVTSGVQPGDMIIFSPPTNLRDGTRVRVTTSSSSL